MIWLPAIIVLPYFFLLLLIFINLLKARQFKSAGPSKATFVSIIIACRNEEQNISVIISDIACQDYPSELFELIVVDDNSDDLTSQIAAKESSGINLKLLRNTGVGKKEAIRTGVINSSADFIITTDADCRLGKNWLRTIVSYYETLKPDLIICPVVTDGGKGFTGKFQELEFLGLQAITTGTALAGKATMCNGANLAFSKATYLNNSGNLHFEIKSGDDIFLLHSIKKQRDSKIMWLESNDAIVRTDNKKRISSFLSQRKRWISKSPYYNDRFTVILAIVTFVTILAQGILMIASVINQSFIIPFLIFLILKSIPDWLLIQSAAARYKRKANLAWFITAQIVYPIYLLVLLIWPDRAGDIKTSSPSQKGI
jgi:cellulose synthase/poly-beta-1,6-N-acetylglucosamine synthase-like glycosyltransferase